MLQYLHMSPQLQHEFMHVFAGCGKDAASCNSAHQVAECILWIITIGFSNLCGCLQQSVVGQQRREDVADVMVNGLEWYVALAQDVHTLQTLSPQVHVLTVSLRDGTRR